MSAAQKRRVLCLAGPTGAGKTALALELAHELGCEILNADSRQVYADFPVITAQPSPEERAQAPHHLYGFLATEKAMDVQTWIELALAKMDELAQKKVLPLLVGGTGMYFQHLLHGIAHIPAIPAHVRQELDERLAKEGLALLYAELEQRDPVLAKRLHPHDTQRIVRGLEVALGTEHELSWWHTHCDTPPLCAGPLLVVDTKLSDLEPLLARRIDCMLEMGALDEARLALERCADLDAPGWSGIGCREIAGHLTGAYSLAQAKELWLKNTRAYAKRQITWFRGRKETIAVGSRDTARVLDIWKRFCDEAAD